jgi:hypothetical protein
MTPKQQNHPSDDHEAVFPLLAGYQQGALTPEDHAMAQGHLSNCPICQEELLHIQSLGAAFEALPARSWQPSAGHFERLMAMVDEHESQQLARSSQTQANPKRSLFSALSACFSETPITMRWIFGLETAVLATLALVLVIPRLPEPTNDGQMFETLTSAPKPLEGTPGQRLHVVFAGDITETEIRGLLQAVHGKLVSGPSTIGVYAVELDSADTGEEALGQAIKTLRANTKVRLVEPISSKASP